MVATARGGLGGRLILEMDASADMNLRVLGCNATFEGNDGFCPVFHLTLRMFTG